MDQSKKWAGWLIAALVAAVGIAVVIMTGGATEPPAMAEPPAASASPSPSAPPAPTQTAAAAEQSRTANVSALGYGGPVLVRLTLDASGAVAAIDVGGVRFKETEGLGSRVREAAFTGQFVGKTPPLALGDDIDGVAGATVSSRAVVEAVNEAHAFLTAQ